MAGAWHPVESGAPVQDQAFALMHADSIRATGCPARIKRRHHADFRSELARVPRLRAMPAAAGRGDGP